MNRELAAISTGSADGIFTLFYLVLAYLLSIVAEFSYSVLADDSLNPEKDEEMFRSSGIWGSECDRA